MAKLSMFRAGALFLTTTALAAPVYAQEFQGANDTSLTVYGQINMGVQYYDDGEEDFTNLVDSNVSTSRVGLNYDVPFGEDRLRFKFETSLDIPRSDNFDQTDDDEFSWSRTNLRKFELVYSSKSYGTFSFGQGSMVTDGLAGEDVSGTNVVATPDPTDLAGNFELRTSGGDLSGIELDDAFSDFDGPRRFRVRYDTPDFSGFSFGVAYGEEILEEDDDNEYYDVGLRYEQELGNLELVGGIGYLWEDLDGDEDTVETLVASGGLLHNPSGISLNLAGGSEDEGGDYGWIQLAWEGDLMSYGTTSFSIDYWGGSDFNVDGSDSDAVTLAAVQRFDDLSLEAYVAYRTYSYDDDAANYQDSDLFFVGARWRF